MNILRFGRYSIKISNEDKILFPKSKVTKGDLIDYYKRVGPLIIPFTKNRPISMIRYPSGIKADGFFQKEVGSYFPKWIDRKKIKKKDGYTDYVIINKIATLAYLANQACISPHIWLSKIDKLNYPDRIIFDLDPSGKSFSMVQEAALLIKEKVENLGLKAFPMITGSRGIHVIIPIKRKYKFDSTRLFAHKLAENLVSENKTLFTLESRKDKRKKLVFIDVIRNAFGQTTIAPYAVRPKENAPVATPISWKEVANAKLKPNKYTIKNIFKRLGKIKDPWENLLKTSYSIPKI